MDSHNAYKAGKSQDDNIPTSGAYGYQQASTYYPSVGSGNEAPGSTRSDKLRRKGKGPAILPDVNDDERPLASRPYPPFAYPLQARPPSRGEHMDDNVPLGMARVSSSSQNPGFFAASDDTPLATALAGGPRSSSPRGMRAKQSAPPFPPPIRTGLSEEGRGPTIPVYASNVRQGDSSDDAGGLTGKVVRRVTGRRSQGGERKRQSQPLEEGDDENRPSQTSVRSGEKGQVGRHKSLVRPERSRVAMDPNSPYYYSANRAAAIAEEAGQDDSQQQQEGAQVSRKATKLNRAKLSRRAPGRRMTGGADMKSYIDEPKMSKWVLFTRIVTCCVPVACMRGCGLRTTPMQQAWREKVGLVVIIVMLCLMVGFLTFGFQQTLCGPQLTRIKGGQFIDRPNAVIHGRLYKLEGYNHPVVTGLSNPDLLANETNAGGKDLSFRFQYLNNKCKDVLIVNDGAGDENGGAYNYFPCVQTDNYASPNPTDNYARVGCHDSPKARKAISQLKVIGDLYYDWEDVRAEYSNYIVYNGAVLNINYTQWYVPWINVPAEIQWFAENDDYKGKDATAKLMSTPGFKAVGPCMLETLKVGYIASNSLGCIATDVVLYVSLVVIVAVVMIKFFMALLFGWVLSWRLGTVKERTFKERRERIAAIEDWEDEAMYAKANSSVSSENASSAAGSGTMNKPPSSSSKRNTNRASFLPTMSRFQTPLPGDEPGGRHRPYSVVSPMGMTPPAPVSLRGTRTDSVGAGSVPSSPFFAAMDAKNAGVPQPASLRDASVRNTSFLDIPVDNLPAGSRLSSLVQNSAQVNRALESAQNPFDFDLIHSICLVTCYSEGVEGLRTTLDSLATTDYPATHKLLLVIADGMIVGSGNDMSTPDICLSMMKDFVIPREEVQSYSYVAIADGVKRHNMAKVYAGYYDYDSSLVPPAKQQRVPMVTIVKCGGPEEQGKAKAGNRGKRDGQVILMSFLQRVMFDERMTELEYEFFNAIWNLSGVPPDCFETVLMVDADTKVYPDSLTRLNAVMVRDPTVMGLCGETKIANKSQSWVSMIQVFEYYISHHLNKAFESIFGGVTCLPGCFCMYRIKAPKGPNGYWVPILCNPDIVEHYAENVVDTLHKKNLLLLGEDRYLTTLMLRTFPKRKMLFVPQAVCKTVVPDTFSVLLSQRRRWINSTVHNLLELVLVRDLCGTFCFSMQFVIFMELVGTVVLPAAISFTLYLIVISFFIDPIPVIPLLLLAAILGLPAVLILFTTRKLVYVGWMLVYLLSLPIWNFVLPAYAFWHFDDFSWGETRMVEGEAKDHTHGDKEGEFDSSKIVMKRWCEFEKDKRQKAIALLGQDVMTWHMGGSEHNSVYGSSHPSLVDLGYAAPPTIGNVAMEVDGNVRHSMLPGGILSTAHGSFALPPPIGDVEAGSSASGSSRGGSYKRSHLGMM